MQNESKRVGVRTGMRGRRLGMLAVCLISAAVIGGVGAIVDAASPSPAASAEPGPQPNSNLEVWLDQPLPVNDAPGSAFDLGFSIWDRSAGGFAELGDVFVRLSPAAGSGAAVEAMARADWPGHATTRIGVPAGGPGELFVGIRAQACPDSGACTTVDFPFATGGIGPPPNASPIDLYVAAIRPPADPLVAGVPANIEVDLSPRADWDTTALTLPSQLILIARHPRGPDFANVPLARGARIGDPYTGKLTVREAGDFAFEVDLPGAAGSADQPYPSSLVRMTVLPAGDAGPPASTGSAGGDGPPISLILGGLVALAAVSLVVRRVFADL
jgi:hypothetical protein